MHDSMRRHVRPRRVRLMSRTAALVCALGGVTLALVDAPRAGRLPRYGGTVRIEVPRLPSDLDPLRLSGEVGSQLGACMYEGLTRWGPDGVEPAIARKWIRSADARRWVFYLHEGVRFHDGAPCDAAAVQESFHGLADAERSSFAWILRDLVGWEDYAAKRTSRIEGIYVVSATEIELHFRKGVSDLPERLALPAAAMVRWQGLVPLGTGPYRAVGSVANALRLTSFAGHREGRPFLDGIDFVTPESPTAGTLGNVARMRRVDPAQALPPGMRRLRSPAARLGLALIHPKSAALSARATRRRLASGFDRSVFVRATLSGDGHAAHGLSPRGSERRDTRIEDRDGDLLQRPRGSVRIVVPGGEPVLKRLADRLQVHLFALGLEANVNVLSPPTLDVAVRAGSYDVLLLGWTPGEMAGAAHPEAMRVRDIVGRLLLPTFGVHAPDEILQVLEDRDGPEEAVLLRNDYVVPLIFFHDAWEVSSQLVGVRLAPQRADLGLTNAHLQPATP